MPGDGHQNGRPGTSRRRERAGLCRTNRGATVRPAAAVASIPRRRCGSTGAGTRTRRPGVAIRLAPDPGAPGGRAIPWSPLRAGVSWPGCARHDRMPWLYPPYQRPGHARASGSRRPAAPAAEWVSALRSRRNMVPPAVGARQGHRSRVVPAGGPEAAGPGHHGSPLGPGQEGTKALSPAGGRPYPRAVCPALSGLPGRNRPARRMR